jgi:hypothetical protein
LDDRGYLAAAGFLGAIGSFISGSVMAGNMTFGAIQKVCFRAVINAIVRDQCSFLLRFMH